MKKAFILVSLAILGGTLVACSSESYDEEPPVTEGSSQYESAEDTPSGGSNQSSATDAAAEETE